MEIMRWDIFSRSGLLMFEMQTISRAANTSLSDIRIQTFLCKCLRNRRNSFLFCFAEVSEWYFKHQLYSKTIGDRNDLRWSVLCKGKVELERIISRTSMSWTECSREYREKEHGASKLLFFCGGLNMTAVNEDLSQHRDTSNTTMELVVSL